MVVSTGVLFTFPGATHAALLSNSGFESDPGGHSQNLLGWQIYGPNTFNETSASIAHNGTNYFKVYQDFSGTVNYSGIYQDCISAPGATYSASGWGNIANNDALAGQNAAWLELSFRDAAGNMLALYRSAVITSAGITSGAFPKSQWFNLPLTNQYSTASYQLTNTVATLVAPAGTVFLRYQVVFQGDANYSGGSVYFDDLNLVRTSSAPYGNMNIVWSDEFDGAAVNTNIWTYDIGNSGWGNQERQYYTSRTNNAFVSNGLLHIVARKESYGGSHYTSARLKSQGLFSAQYGRLEWRAKLPQGVGYWPALWLLGTNITSVGWPNCGEIDVMENVGSNPFMSQSSIHYGSSATAIYNFIDGESATNFNTYTLDWTTNAFLFYVNGRLFETQTTWNNATAPFPYPFNQPFFLIMNMAVGGTYLGLPTTNAINAGTVFPGEVLVDYVRIYKSTDAFRIGIRQTGNDIVLSWPSNIVCRLEVQTNGLGTNWSALQTGTNQVQITPVNGSAFFRLVTP